MGGKSQVLLPHITQHVGCKSSKEWRTEIAISLLLHMFIGERIVGAGTRFLLKILNTAMKGLIIMNYE